MFLEGFMYHVKSAEIFSFNTNKKLGIIENLSKYLI